MKPNKENEEIKWVKITKTPSEKLVSLFEYLCGFASLGFIVCFVIDIIFDTDLIGFYFVHCIVYGIVGFFIFLGIAFLYWVFIGWWYEAY